MALLSTKGDLPKGAIKLSESEALNYQWQQVITWPKYWDVWPFKFGIHIISIAAGITAVRINRYVRIKLQLRHYGLITSNIATGISSVVFTAATHLSFVTNPILVYSDGCPICIGIKATVLQTLTGVVYPCVLSPFANFVLAIKYATYAVPYFNDKKGLTKLCVDMIMPIRKKIGIFALVNIALAGSITFAEGYCLNNIRLKLIEQASQRLLKEMNDEDLQKQ